MIHHPSLNSPRAMVAGPSPSPSPSLSPSVGEQQPFLHVSVTDPVKLGSGVQSYVSYRVSTKTNMPEYRGPEKIVIRRYNDFSWLHERLVEKYKGIFIPPLPEKNAVEKFRFGSEFIELRRRALEVYVNRIASHPQLQNSEDLRNFLQADEEVWANEKGRLQETTFFSKKPSDLVQMFKDVQSKVSDAVLGKEKPAEESDPDYEKMKHYILELEDHLMEAQKQSFRLVKRHKELGQALSDFGKAMKGLGNCEGNSLGNAFMELGSQSEVLSYKLQKQGQDLLMNFEEPIKEYARAVQSIKNVISDRAQAFRLQQELVESAKLKEINLEKLRVLRSDKVLEAEVDFRETKLKSEEAKKRFEMIVRSMQQEILRFQEEKTRDLGAVFYTFARGQAQLATDIANAWRSIIPKLETWSP